MIVSSIFGGLASCCAATTTLIEADQDDLEEGLDVRLSEDIVYHNGKDNKQPSILEADERVKTETNDNDELSFSEENNKKSQSDANISGRNK